MPRMVAIVETSPRAVEEGELLRRRLAMDQAEGGVAAEDAPALAGQALGQAARGRGHRRDRHDAERQAGDEDAEAAQAAAQVAPGQPERERDAGGAGGRRGRRA